MPGDYPFENLGDERFQQLCQALLVRERPTVQCFPVGQPDGGRDAVAYITGRQRPFVVYQVKFSRQEAGGGDSREWLRRALVKEVPKVLHLAELGASEYVVMTNVSGTGHSEVGSIDRIDDLFTSELPIPAFCMWRDDLSRRLDGAWDLKWAYPEVMTGPDLLRAVIEAGGAEDRNRRSNALHAFLASQYYVDQQVRFRQVDLESPLLDLFIDVPLAGVANELRSSHESGKRVRQRLLHAMVVVSRDLYAQAGEQGHHSTGEGDRFRGAVENQQEVGTSSTHGTSRLGASLSQQFASPFEGHAIQQPEAYQALRIAWAHTPATAQLALWDEEDFDRLYDEQSHTLLAPAMALGAAAFLSHPFAAAHFPAIVLEGAPGQGKSTVTQFLCQIHRMRLLNKQFEQARLSAEHRPRGARLPIRADLRDLAAWLGRRNPFATAHDGTMHPPPLGWEPSLEAFLAALISHQSGGTQFGVSDLLEVARVSALLIVLDGLDEVADPKRRTTVVDVIREGAQRLGEHAASLQIIVTSRPAAFATSPGLSESEFPRLQLGPVTKPLALAYADRWLAARHVIAREASEFRSALTAKLDLPHLRELARNPMQLAILLSLLNTRGVSLPDKRTALYTSYIDVFFGREAEKSPTVRDHRDLLLALHGYLAWLLHAEAETTEGDERGRITQERLRREVRGYLENEGHDDRLVDRLFVGVVDRVIALVSRVQGTFEFEVQPLREYFAGRYLYQTAKYSRAGEEHLAGTKPDRFDQIARNPYWLNVTRFFCGFFDKGELPMLVERLQDLADDPLFKNTSHPATVAATLLADWVFAQTPRTVSQVVNLVLDPPRLKVLLAGAAERGAAGDPLFLANECGRISVLDRVFAVLTSEPPWDYRFSLITLSKANSSLTEREGRWREAMSEMKHSGRSSRYAWLHTGWMLDVLDRVPAEDLISLLVDSPPSHGEALLLARARRSDVISSVPGAEDAVLEGVLAGLHLGSHGGGMPDNLVEGLAWVLEPRNYGIFHADAYWVHHADRPTALQEVVGAPHSEWVDKLNAGGFSNEMAKRVTSVLKRAAAFAIRPSQEWMTSIDPWEGIVEASRAELGESWAHVAMAAEAALVRPTGGKGTTGVQAIVEDDLLDHDRSLVRRVWFARRRANASDWWGAQLAAARTDYEYALVTVLMTTWASSKVVEANEAALDDAIRALTPRWWSLVASRFRRLARGRTRRRGSQMGASRTLTHVLRSDLDVRTLTLLRPRLEAETRRRLYEERLLMYDGSDHHVLSWAQSEALHSLAKDPTNWPDSLRVIAAAYEADAYGSGDGQEFQRFERAKGARTAADEVLANPAKYPQTLIAAAERRVRQDIGIHLKPVALTATQEGWFEL